MFSDIGSLEYQQYILFLLSASILLIWCQTNLSLV